MFKSLQDLLKGKDLFYPAGTQKKTHETNEKEKLYPEFEACQKYVRFWHMGGWMGVKAA